MTYIQGERVAIGNIYGKPTFKRVYLGNRNGINYVVAEIAEDGYKQGRYVRDKDNVQVREMGVEGSVAMGDDPLPTGFYILPNDWKCE